jgi:hypothetical protein
VSHVTESELIKLLIRHILCVMQMALCFCFAGTLQRLSPKEKKKWEAGAAHEQFAVAITGP